MRFDKPIYFVKITKGEFDPESGNHFPDTSVETKRFASVTDSGVETMNLIYGAIRQGVKTIRLQAPYTVEYDCIRIGSKIYRVDFRRDLRLKQVLVVSEVQ